MAAVQTDDGGYATAGYTFAFGSGGQDFYLVKTDSLGNLLWTHTYGGIADERCYYMQQTSDHGFIMVGYTQSFGPNLPYENGYVVKTDSAGNVQWSTAFGGNGGEFCYYAQQTSDGDYIIAAVTSDSFSPFQDGYLVKLDSNGNIIWSKHYGSSINDRFTAVLETPDRGYIVGGNFWSQGMWLLKTDSAGIVQWSKTYGGETISSLVQTLDGGYMLCGDAGSDIALVKTDVNGDTLWTKTYGGPNVEHSYSVQQLADSSYVVTGMTSFMIGQNDVYTFKVNPQGNLLWTKISGGTAQDESRTIVQTTDGGFILTGFAESFHGNYQNVYLIKTDANGNSRCNQITPDILPGNFAFTINVLVGLSEVSAPTISVIPATLVGTGGAQETLCLTTAIDATENLHFQFSISPNPTTGTFNIESNLQNAELKIYDVMGKEVYAAILNTKYETLNTHLAPGIYFVNAGGHTQKLVVQ